MSALLNNGRRQRIQVSIETYNAYQQTHGPKVEYAMPKGERTLAVMIGANAAGKT
jgi:hypothetical protein